MNFKNKNCVITGASKGIGKAVAQIIAENNGNLLLLDINEEGLKEVKESISNKSINIEIKKVDISDENDVNNTINEYLNRNKKIDVLINNASIYHNHFSFRNSESTEWKNKINVNILGTMYMCKAIIENMVSNKYGKIVNIASVAGVYGDGGMCDYAMTKGAIISFTKSLAKEVGPLGINVNAVSPGSIDVGAGNLPELSYLGRSGSVTECANVICFLASDDSSYVNGQNYLVDGLRKKI